MNLVLLGPPGAGKGTVAARLAEDQGIPHISTGDIFRENIKKGTDLGKRVKEIMDQGELVPDELTIQLVENRLKEPDAANGYILDGFPRTIPQAEALDRVSRVDTVLRFDLDDEEIVRRLSGRRVHPDSGRVYHVEFSPPQVEGKDDVTGEPLVTRSDDTVEAVKNRLEVYREQTAPLVDYYRNQGKLTDIDAAPSPEEVLRNVKEALGKA
jgi:adenylate kinase